MDVTWQCTLPEGPTAVSVARREIGFLAMGRGDVDDAVLIASELCTNAFLHGKPPVILRAVIQGDLMRIEVENRRNGHSLDADGPRLMPNPREEGGRGLAIVEALADDWGAKDADGATCVWAELRD
jgi:serine/threonine-protein kinase RsbW